MKSKKQGKVGFTAGWKKTGYSDALILNERASRRFHGTITIPEIIKSKLERISSSVVKRISVIKIVPEQTFVVA